MSELGTLKEENYISASDAAKLIGYSSDYVTRLAREEKIVAKQVNRRWFIEIDSLKLFSLQVASEKRARKEDLREERLHERASTLREANEVVLQSHMSTSRVSALAQTSVLAVSLFLFVNIVWFSFEEDISASNIVSGLSNIGSELSKNIFEPIPEFVTQTASFAFIQSDAELAVVSSDSLESGSQASSDQSAFQGIVVFENDQVTPKAVDAVRESFSDEVRIDFEGDDTGVITPVFKDREGDDYRFLLVPVNAEEN
jgi:hypothetical protein